MRWIILGLVLAGAVVGIGFLLPRPVDFFPVSGSTQVPPWTALRLVFSQPMQAESVLASLQIEPLPAGEFSWDDNTLVFSPSEAWRGGETITVSLTSGARSALGLPLVGTQTWQFIISRPLVAYLWPLEGPSALYALDPITGVNQRLTPAVDGVLDFDVIESSGDIIYALAGSGAGSSLWRWERLSQESHLLLDCPDLLCSQGQVSPDQRWLAYVRAVPESQIWLISLADGAETRVSSTGHPAGLPNWSPLGWLSFYDQAEQSFEFLQPESGERMRIPNETGEPLSWAPDGSAFVTSEVIFLDFGPPDYSSHLVRYTFPGGQRTDLSLLTSLEDANPVYAPNGRWLAFSRKSLDATTWTPGRQLWLLQANGGGARQLSNEPPYSFSNFAWSPAGDWLVYVRSNQTAPNEPSELWLVDPFDNQLVRLWIGGYAPQWIP